MPKARKPNSKKKGSRKSRGRGRKRGSGKKGRKGGKRKSALGRLKDKVAAQAKIVARVKTQFADEKVEMWRQYLNPEAFPMTSSGEVDGSFQDGDYIAGDRSQLINMQYPKLLAEYFHVGAFHGKVQPSWQLDNKHADDDNYNPEVGVDAHLTDYGNQQNNDDGVVGYGSSVSTNPLTKYFPKSDVRAMKVVSVPYLPGFYKRATNYSTEQQIEKYFRNGDSMRILNNYMKFQFYTESFSKGKKYEYTTGPGFKHTGNTEAYANTPMTYQITVPVNAYARIILVERKLKDFNPHDVDGNAKDAIYLNDFLEPDYRSYGMGSEEMKMNDYFRRGLKTTRDLPVNLDHRSILEERMKVRVVHDKVFRLKKDGLTTVTLNTMKGKVLQFAETQSAESIYRDDTNTTMANDFTFDNRESDERLPLDVNQDAMTATNLLQSASERMKDKMQFYPINHTYGMWMFIKCQMCSVEYDIKQKITYDK